MAIHSSILAWRIPWTEDPGELQSMVSQRVGHKRAHTQHTYQKKKTFSENLQGLSWNQNGLSQEDTMFVLNRVYDVAVSP